MVLRKKVFFDRQYLVKMKIVIAEIKGKIISSIEYFPEKKSILVAA
jgi:hypothetical protein